jgi:hypothetical protein
MKHQWTVRRSAVPHPDAQRRWDRAFALLLAPHGDDVLWAAAPLTPPLVEESHVGQPPVSCPAGACRTRERRCTGSGLLDK